MIQLLLTLSQYRIMIAHNIGRFVQSILQV